MPFTTGKRPFTPTWDIALFPMLQSPQSNEERTYLIMKKVLAQIGKALAYFLTYLLTSNVISLIVSCIVGYVKGREYGAAGMDRDAAMAALQSDNAAMTGICLLLGAIATLLVYFIIEKVKKSNLAKETDIKAVSPKHIILTVIGALGGMVFMNFIMSILPIPAELTGDLANGMSKLTAYPFWQALLANCIFVPIIEEVVFRGYIFNRLSKAMPQIVAAIISSVVFGICHGSLLWAIWAFVLGMIICLARIKTGSIIPGIIFHIIMNTFAMVVSYYPVLENMNEGIMYALTAAGAVLLAVYVVGFFMERGKVSDKPKAEVVIAPVEK